MSLQKKMQKIYSHSLQDTNKDADRGIMEGVRELVPSECRYIDIFYHTIIYPYSNHRT